MPEDPNAKPTTSERRLNVPPQLASDDSSNGVRVNMEIGGDRSLRMAQLGTSANREYIFRNQFRAWVFLASVLSALANHIFSIIGVGAKKQVFRITARRVIAVMEYAKTIRYRSFRDLISQPMSEDRALLAVDSGFHSAIALAASFSRPDPAIISFINVKPQPFSHWFTSSVPPQQAHGLTFNVPVSLMVVFRNLRFVATAASA
jgi:hypothetical protein